MPRFFYIARNKSGKKDSGAEDASNQEELIKKLQAKDLFVINIFTEQKEALTDSKEVTAKAKIKHKHYGIGGDDLVLFCRQLATLLGAGVTILKSLEIIAMQVSSHKLFSVIKDLQRSMEAGLSFHEAMSKHSDVFSDLWINLVESGEASGSLAMVLTRLAGYLERNAAFKKKIISALIYPIILICAAMFALLFITIKIIPTFMELFSGFNITLPLLTRILMHISTFVKNYIFIIAFLVVFAYVSFHQYISTKTGRKRFEKFLFNLPIFGEFFKVLIFERFTSEMGTLLESGVPILYSLEITEHSVGNLVMGDIVRKMKDDVRQGKPLSQPLEKSGFFDAMSVQMVAIGEEIGELSNMFKRLNVFYQQYLDTFLERFSSMFEPIMLLFLGFVIGAIVIGMFLPIFQITKIQ